MSLFPLPPLTRYHCGNLWAAGHVFVEGSLIALEHDLGTHGEVCHSKAQSARPPR